PLSRKGLAGVGMCETENLIYLRVVQPEDGRAVKGELAVRNTSLDQTLAGRSALIQRLDLVPVAGEEQIKVGAFDHAPVSFSLLMEHELLQADLGIPLGVYLLPG